MNPNSKYFNMVRHGSASLGRGSAFSGLRFCARGADVEREDSRPCGAENCARPARHPAPRPRGETGLFWFCFDHVRDYNRNYNFFKGMSAAEFSAYEKSAEVGHRPTWPLGSRGAGQAWRAQIEEILRQFHFGKDSKIRSKMENRSDARQEALSVLGLSKNANQTAIRARFKILVKRYHPDSNGGARNHEAQLARVIQAYRILKPRTEQESSTHRPHA